MLYEIGWTIDSRQVSLPAGTTSSAPPRPCARIDTASCTSTFTDCAHEAGSSKPRSDVSSGGQSGRFDVRSSTIFSRSPSSTATLTNLPEMSPRWCLITSSPGEATSSTKQ